MISQLKLLISLIIVAFSSSFVPHVGPSATRSVQDTRSVGSTSSLFSTIEAPTKSPDIEIASDFRTEEVTGRDPLWAVRLYNDPMNKREFVARCLVEICSLDDGEAFSVMMNAHQNGLSVIGVWQRELAEMYKQRLQENGLFVDMVPHDDGEKGGE
ncbi:hypothetical protein ACHAXN_007442 [Cyclotella atomus]